MKKAILIPYTFNLMNWAVIAGLYHFLHHTAARDIWLDSRIRPYPQGAGR